MKKKVITFLLYIAFISATAKNFDPNWSSLDSMMVLGSISVYSVLIAVGHIIYGNKLTGLFVFFISIISSFGLIKIWK